MNFFNLTCCLIAFIAFPVLGLSQTKVEKTKHVDTVRVYSETCNVVHYHERSYEKGKQMFSMHDNDIFNDTINDFSKLLIFQSGGYDLVKISTIPLDNIIIAEKEKLIIGLTQIGVSPYKIVMYNYFGKLLYKGNLGAKMIKIDFNKLVALTKTFPALITALKQSGNVIKQDSLYYVELSNEIRHILGDNYLKEYFSGEPLYTNNYLPFQITTFWSNPYRYHRVKGGYLGASPYNDLIVINGIPFILILNNVEGSKSYIPLVSNCDIEKELSFQ